MNGCFRGRSSVVADAARTRRWIASGASWYSRQVLTGGLLERVADSTATAERERPGRRGTVRHRSMIRRRRMPPECTKMAYSCGASGDATRPVRARRAIG